MGPDKGGAMNLTQLRAFVAVVDQRSFSGAARALGLSQPAITMQVQSLEADAGATLLDRRYRNVELTEAGTTLLPYARDVLARLEEARDRLDSLSGRVTGRLEIAASTTPGDYVIPALLGGFLAANPEVGVAVRVLDSGAVVEAVANGTAQFGMTGARLPNAERVAFEPIGEDRLVVVAPLGSPLAGRSSVRVADLAEEAFIMRRAGSGTRLVTENALAEGGLEPGDLRVVTEFSTSEAIVRAVEGGLGIGVVSTWAVGKALQLGTVAQVDVAGFPISRPFFTVLPAGKPTRAAEAFREYLREAIA
jgi:DNA-binding transcriptional LysR family regulator